MSVAIVAIGGAIPAQAQSGSCPPIDLTGCTALAPAAGGPAVDLEVAQCLTVGDAATPYVFHHVNVVESGRLIFLDPGVGNEIDFQVNSMLVEQGGLVQAGTACDPFGTAGGHLRIGLWGDDPTAQGTQASTEAIQCLTESGQCYPDRVGKFCIDPTDPSDPCNSVAPNEVGLNAMFEGYNALPFDNKGGGAATRNFFGFKVLGVSYGGQLKLFGAKGVAAQQRVPETPASCPVPADPTSVDQWAQLTGGGWARLDKSEKVEASGRRGAQKETLKIDRIVDWEPGDHLVVATTDWHPGHSELVTISAKDKPDDDRFQITQDLAYPHFGEIYDVEKAAQGLPEETGNPNTEIDMRAAVGLLSRSITIESLGEEPMTPFPAAAECGFAADRDDCYFGGHVIARQGFGAFQVQGVEFRHLGQGGRMGHYPAHAHAAKSTAYTDAFIKDSSVWASNNRFIVLHGTHDFTLARNVGYLSVGHAYYMEDGSEINNLLCQNLGVSARGALEEYYQAQDPASETYRYIPPILDGTCRSIADCNAVPPATSVKGDDSLNPVMFWAMNQYNEFVGNMAAGVHGFGSCFWFLGSNVSGASRSLSWTTGSDSEQDYADFNKAGATQAPLKRFRGNSCSTATYGLQTSIEIEPLGAIPGLTPVANPYIANDATQFMRPIVAGNFVPVKFGLNPKCDQGLPASDPDPWALNVEHCMTTIIDRFTTSFNWAEVNVGSVWLRPQWFIFLNSAITDQLSGGLGFVGGGSWAQVPPAFFDLTKDSLFVGTTRKQQSQDSKDDRFDSELGPDIDPSLCVGPTCVLPKDGTGYFIGGLAPKRMMTIYDGPFYSEASIFTDTGEIFCNPVDIESCEIYKSTQQPVDVPKEIPALLGDLMRVANAGIAWKQTNAFYYPPAFAFLRSGFDAITQRHYVLDQGAPYYFGSAAGNPDLFDPLFPNFNSGLGVTPIDVSTILNDLDGTLTGMEVVTNDQQAELVRRRTSSVSNNAFFDAPAQLPECESFGVQTSPFDFVTTVVGKLEALPEIGSPTVFDFCTDCAASDAWNKAGTLPVVPIYRQYLLPDEEDRTCGPVCGQDPGTWGCDRATFMGGSQNGTAPYLTTNRGLYYIDTDQQSGSCVKDWKNGVKVEQFHVPGFDSENTYVLHHLFANEETKITYQIYVGPNFNLSDGTWVRIFPHRFDGGSGNNMLVERDDTYPGIVAPPENGVLTVTLDNTLIADEFEFAAREEREKCMPRDICQISEFDNECVLSEAFSEDQLKDTIDAVCKSWVTATAGSTPLEVFDVGGDIPAGGENVSLMECPAEGCLGYAFKLTGFSPMSYADVGNALTQDYPTGASPDAEFWDVDLKVVDPKCVN